MVDTTIVIPCYNEASRLPLATLSQFSSQARAYRFVFVNDGSADGTLMFLRHMQDRHGHRSQTLSLPLNCGKAEAVRRGMKHALQQGTPFVGYWDADLATPLDALSRFRAVLIQQPHIHAVVGTRLPMLGHHIRRRPARRLLGRVFALAASTVLGVRMRDTQCGAKLFRSSHLLNHLLDQPFHARWAFDVELLARWQLATRDAAAGTTRLQDALYELPLDTWRDVGGSKLKSSAMLRAAAELAGIAIRYRMPNTANRTAPVGAMSASPASQAPAAAAPQLRVLSADLDAAAPTPGAVPPVRSLLLGPPTWLQRICMQSFVEAGHPYELFTYEQVQDVPAGVVRRDAHGILPRHGGPLPAIRRAADTSHLLDLFRYRLLLMHGGYWVDPDVFCLRRFDFELPYVFGEGDEPVDPCVLRAPAGSPLLQQLSQLVEFPGRTGRSQALPPGALAAQILGLNLMDHVKPRALFCPFSADQLREAVTHRCSLPLPGGGYAVKLHQQIWPRGFSRAGDVAKLTRLVQQLKASTNDFVVRDIAS